MLVANFFFVGCEKTEDELLEQCFKVKILDDVYGSAVVKLKMKHLKNLGLMAISLKGLAMTMFSLLNSVVQI